MVGVWDEKSVIGYGEGVTTGWGDGVSQEQSICDERLLSIGGGAKSIPVVGGGSFN